MTKKFVQQNVNRLDSSSNSVVGGFGIDAEPEPSTNAGMNTLGNQEQAGMQVMTRISKEMNTLKINDTSWSIEIADDITQGLSNTKSLPESTGMLFELPSKRYNVVINMLEMQYPLDIIFITEDNIVSQVLTNLQPKMNSMYSGKPVKYFFEVNKGEGKDIKSGDKVIVKNNAIQKSKVYLSASQMAPNNTAIQIGKKGGRYYNTDIKSELQIQNINNIKNILTELVSKTGKNVNEINSGSCASFIVILRNKLGYGQPVKIGDHYTLGIGNNMVVDASGIYTVEEAEKKRHLRYGIRARKDDWNDVLDYITHDEFMPIPIAKKIIKTFDSLSKSHQLNPPWPGAQFNEQKHRWVVPKKEVAPTREQAERALPKVEDKPKNIPKSEHYYAPENVRKPAEVKTTRHGFSDIEKPMFTEHADFPYRFSNLFQLAYKDNDTEMKEVEKTIDKVYTFYPTEVKVWIEVMDNYIQLAEENLSDLELDHTINLILNNWTDKWIEERTQNITIDDKAYSNKWTGKLVKVMHQIDKVKKNLIAAKHSDSKHEKVIAFDNLMSTAHVYEPTILTSILGIYPRGGRAGSYSKITINDYQLLGHVTKNILQELGYKRDVSKSFEIMHKAVLFGIMEEILKQDGGIGGCGTISSSGFTPTSDGGGTQKIDFYGQQKKIKKNIEDLLNKSKEYLAEGEKPPYGVRIQVSERGKKFYNTEDIPAGGVMQVGKKKSYKTVMTPLNATRSAKHTMKTPGGVPIQPGITNVFVCVDPESPLQYMGKDEKGRTKMFYSDKFTKENQSGKFARLKSFTEEYHSIISKIEKDFSKSEEASILYLVAKTGFRIGSENDTKAEKEAFGATTLKCSHTVINGDRIKFEFPSKKGGHTEKEILDPLLAKKIGSSCAKDRNKKIFDSSDDKCRVYLASIKTKTPYVVKDFRLYKGTQTALKVIKNMPSPKTEKDMRKAQKKVAEIVSEDLCNTPSVALSHYISPEVWSGWMAGLKIESKEMIQKSTEDDRELMQNFVEQVEYDTYGPSEHIYDDEHINELEESEDTDEEESE